MTSRLEEQLRRYGTYLDSLLIEVEPEQAIDRATRRSRQPLPEGVVVPTWRRGLPPHRRPGIERRAARRGVAGTPSWLHGAWVAAATATAVLIFAGGVVAGRWLLDPGSLLDAALGESSPFNPATPADASVLALVVAGTTGGSVLLAGALTFAWRWRKRNGLVPLTNARGEEMETMEKTIEKPQRTMEQVTRSNRWLILTVVVLLAVLAALGAWLLVDNLVGNESTVGAETEQEINVLIDDWLTAFSTGDGQLFMDLFTDDGRYVSAPTPYGGVSGEELKGYVERQMGGQFDLVRTGTLIVERPNSYHVALKYRAHEDYDREYYFMLNVAKEDGSLKFRYAEGWQPLGWFQIADGLPPRPVGDPSEIAR